jgi:hypothetical protein
MHNILTDAEVAHLFELFKDRQNTFIQKVIKALPDLIYVMNLDTHAIIYSSRLIALEIGYSAQAIDAMTHPILDIMHPDDLERFVQHLQDVKSSKPGEVLSIEFRLIRNDGKIAWFIDRNTIFTRNINGIAVTKIGITHEITERKAYEEDLLKHKQVIEQSEILAGSGSWAYDHSSRVFTWSAGMYRLFNLPHGTTVQPSIYKHYSANKDLAVAERTVQAIEEAKAPFEEILHITVDGEIRSLKIKGSPVYGNSSSSRQMIGVDLDITSTEQKERQLKRLNKELGAKNRDIQYLHADLKTFADITATDYQTHFKNIYTAFESLITHEAPKFSNNGKGAVRKIQASLQRMNLLTDDIQAYLHISSGNTKKETVSLDQVVNDVIGSLGNLTAMNVVINKGELGAVRANGHLMHILLRNLIDNAIKFRSEETRTVIDIRCNLKDITRDPDGDTSAERLFKLYIEDNGIGFDPTAGEEIFELFYKNHHNRRLRGSGVGLAVARKIMNIHNGFITAESKPGHGSVFTCYFPVSAADEE